MNIDGIEYSFTQPCCDTCWPTYAVETRGYEFDPVRIIEEHRDEETCCFCGETTLSGIYVRVDPRTVDHPTPEEDD